MVNNGKLLSMLLLQWLQYATNSRARAICLQNSGFLVKVLNMFDVEDNEKFLLFE